MALGLGSSVALGAGDFGGGWSSRRAPVLGVSLVVQIIGFIVTLAAAVLVREPFPEAGSVGLGIVAGMLGVAGIIALYHGLAVGRMGVVAPVTGVLAAIVPVVAGFVLQGLPALPVWAGIALAIVAVVLVSRAAGVEGGRSGIEFALAAGLGIGLYTVFLGLIPEGGVFWPLAVMKASALVVLAAIIGIGRGAWRVPRAVLPVSITVGVCDMLGNGLFLLAAQIGGLAVAAVLTSLYPATTVILAAVLLHERITRSHVAGIVAAITAIVLIGVGTA
ncbi:MAG TPA: DMT family transporter [Candidatus Limnocylindrales bacterium]|nr:DMT family transporter [Candidatus Limnocylindrales bacterium]